MLGSMGLAAAIGLGLALAEPAARVVVLDGDGNVLMGLGVLPMAGAWQPRCFLHVVFDNGTYASTGGQLTVSPAVDLAATALACGYRRAAAVDSEAALREKAAAFLGEPGPSLLHVRVSSEEPAAQPRVDIEPPEIARRFGAAVEARVRVIELRQPSTLWLGSGSTARAGEVVRRLGGRRAFLVTTPGMVARPVFSLLAGSLEQAGIAVTAWSGTPAEPGAEELKRAVARARAAEPDVVVGLGGGSALDLAKLTAMLLVNGGAVGDYFGIGRVPRPACRR